MLLHTTLPTHSKPEMIIEQNLPQQHTLNQAMNTK